MRHEENSHKKKKSFSERRDVLHWRALLRLVLAALVPFALLIAILTQWGQQEEQQPEALLDGRYLARVHRVDIRYNFENYFEEPRWKKMMSSLKYLWGNIKSEPSETFSEIKEFIDAYAPRRNHWNQSDNVYFFVSYFDQKTGSYVTSKECEWKCVAFYDSQGEEDTTGMHERSQVEEKNGLKVHAYSIQLRNPMATHFYLVFASKNWQRAVLRLPNPHTARFKEKLSTLPAWAAKPVTLPLVKKVDDFEVTFSGITLTSSHRNPCPFQIRRNGRDAGGEYTLATKIEDIWGIRGFSDFNGTRHPGTHSPYWRFRCVLYEYGNAVYPSGRLFSLGKQKRPKPQEAVLVDKTWQNGAEAIKCVYLLGTGRHFFSGGRWLRSEPLPAEAGRWDERMHGQWELDEGGVEKRAVQSFDVLVPAIYGLTQSNMPVAVLGCGVVAGKHNYAGNADAGHSVLDLQQVRFEGDEWGRGKNYRMLIPVDWPEREVEKAITLAVPLRREFEFCVPPDEVFKEYMGKK